MKDQYFGDIGDYHKYSIIKAISLKGDLNVLVCWMYTQGDGRSDGRFIQYLSSPQYWRYYEPLIFDFLADAVLKQQCRKLALVESSKILPNTTFFRALLQDSVSDRSSYFDELKNASEKADIIFLDPDNGLEVTSVKNGKKNSSKYLYWSEISKLFSIGKSLMIYQHFNRSERNSFIRKKALDLLDNLTISKAFSIRTTHSFYLIAPQYKHMSAIKRSIESIRDTWRGKLLIEEHKLDSL